jgi:hypothetical protein
MSEMAMNKSMFAICELRRFADKFMASSTSRVKFFADKKDA